ncbi:MAG: hypothetical protein A3B31_03005 [Candidatus Komeilibacteria bacterium RIFCSPLOWO2_01_FULL_53_11]|uniref:Phospholipid/glycerol acyltransferase domain-containing protein n=1 Tax=Candidatus Komeilibacteria bacterium RIFCSPLOWO2_01_FULL_53_11 TaxID=1798552 RepID=A0A1G2BR66_9BACT|nr:MAG: hypothetical protein A3B31_03005 [Candidatus Komeilibacteria bacterium RIFCSPLOWO2_01_FULL_53_11]
MIFWLCTYPLGFGLGVFFSLLRLTGRVRIVHPERIPKEDGALIVASNHPSLWEPIILTMLFFPRCLLYPHRRLPWSTPSTKTYYDWWFLFPLHPRFIMVPRTDQSRILAAFRQMIAIIRNGERLIIFPEGGRTYRGNSYQYGANGRRIRGLKSGIEKLVKLTSVPVLPVWVEGSDHVLPNGSRIPRLWRKVTIVIGEPTTFPIADVHVQNAVTKKIGEALLKLSEEVTMLP